jgi:hypothetical protein
MATHDYVIDNSTGANVRADINNVLAAIVSNNSGSSEPATKYAYQWWADTSAGVLKIRNSANNAWVELLQLDGTLTLEDGSASTPALAFRDDLNTGIFSSAGDTFNIATGGVERMELGATTVFNEDGANVDFRIEGDNNANLFYLDAGNDRVGIGLNNPNDTFHVFHATDNLVGRFESGDTGAGITLKDNTHVTSLLTTNGAFEINVDSGGDITGESLAFKISGSEKARFDSSGRLNIGTDLSDSTMASVAGLVNIHTTNTGTHNSLTLFWDHNNTTTNIEQRIQFSLGDNASADSYVNAGYIAIGKADTWVGNANRSSYLSFATSNAATQAERMRIDSAGNVGIGVTDVKAALQINSDKNAETDRHDGSNYHLFLRNPADDNGEACGLAFSVTSNATKTGAAIMHEREGGGSQGSLQFYTNGDGNSVSERMRIDSSGRVHIGNSGLGATSSADDLTVGNLSGDHGITIHSATDSAGFICFGDTDTTGIGSRDGVIRYQQSDNTMRFATNGNNERMRIGDNGEFLVGRTNTISVDGKTVSHVFEQLFSNAFALGIHAEKTNKYGMGIFYTSGGTANNFLVCNINGSNKFELKGNGGLANVQSNDVNLSDIAVKKNITDATSTINEVKQWEIKEFHYTEDDDISNKRYGVIAQQVETIDPRIVTNYDSKLKGVKEQQMYWKAIKALQEEIVKREALEARIVALETN